MLSLSHVSRYMELGFVVHPCCPPSHRCQSPGKIPFDPVAGKHMTGWQSHEQFSEEQWQEWIDYDSEINIGFLTGYPSQLLCLDIDNEAGRRLLDELGIEEWQETWQYRTGRGFRCLFHHGEKSISRVVSRGDSHIEVLGDGRQSVLPPSVHPNGRQYHWVSGRTPRDGRARDAGGWLGHLISEETITSDKEDWTKKIQLLAHEGERNTTMVRLAGHLMNPCPMPEEEAYLWLQMYNKYNCKPPLPDHEIRSIVNSISKKEASQQAQKDREVREIMKQYDLTYEEAETVWRSM
jgi:hypothetical protein